ACGDFRSEQAENGAVFVGAPDCAVFAKETGARAFLAPETAGAVKQARREPFEADGDFPKRATKAGNDAIDEATADESFAYDRGCRPLRTVSKEITDSDSKVMVRVQQAGRGGDNSVTIRVGIVAEGDVEAVLEFDQAGHRKGAGAIHPDFAV